MRKVVPVVAACLLTAFRSVDAAPLIQGWHVKVEHSDGARHRVQVWKDGFRIDDGVVTTFYRANSSPQIVIFSDENEAYAAISLKELMTAATIPPLVPRSVSYRIGKPTVEMSNGLKLHCYPGYESTSNKLFFKVWTLHDIASPEVNRAACQFALIPEVPGFPVKAQRILNGRTSTFLKTISVERGNLDFTPLKNVGKYQKVSSLMEIIFRNGKKPLDQSDLDALFFAPKDTKK